MEQMQKKIVLDRIWGEESLGHPGNLERYGKSKRNISCFSWTIQWICDSARENSVLLRQEVDEFNMQVRTGFN